MGTPVLHRQRNRKTEPADTTAGLGADHPLVLLTGQMGGEVAEPLSAALERLTAFATTGTISRQSLRALRDDIDRARRVGIMGQQLSRFAGGRVRQTHERLNLTQMLRDVLHQRQREIAARSIDIKQMLKPAEVIVDASVLFLLLQTLLDWAFQHARSHVEFRLDVKSWPVHARLVCHFAHHPADEVSEESLRKHAEGTPFEADFLNTTAWLLLQQASRSLGVLVSREDSPGTTELTLEFPRTVNDQMEGVSAVELDGGAGPALNSRPLAGSHVLVLSGRRELRSMVRDAIRHMGLMIDFVTSVDEAREFCSAGLPHAIIFDGELAGDSLEALRQELKSEVSEFVFIEIVEHGRAFEVCGVGPAQVARVGRDALLETLPSALVFELSKAL